MMTPLERFLVEHRDVTRRYFLRAGASTAAVAGFWPLNARADSTPALEEAIAELESYLTPPDEFRDVSRGKPVPHSLPLEKKHAVGMTRDSWKLEVVSDPDHPADLRNPLSEDNQNALDFPGLMQLASQHAVRFAKVMTCLNIGCPLGMGIWEGVPLREVFWMTKPRQDIRRLYYYGYHNDTPSQMFRSSLPIDRVLEDPDELPPVILCYKLNGQWLTSERGGPVRIVVPEAYGFKSIKWLKKVVVTNLFYANDTYGEKNNDVASRLKSFAATLSVPKSNPAGASIPITGYAQVGDAGLSKVQVWVHPNDQPLPRGDAYFRQAPWTDATILPPPEQWGGNLPDNRLPHPIRGFDSESGEPDQWPMRLTKVHWAKLLSGLKPGEYTLRSRTVDKNGQPQPLPRPFRKSGHAVIEQVQFAVES